MIILQFLGGTLSDIKEQKEFTSLLIFKYFKAFAVRCGRQYMWKVKMKFSFPSLVLKEMSPFSRAKNRTNGYSFC